MFTKNVGKADRKFRLFFGIALVILASIAYIGLGIIPKALGFFVIIIGLTVFATGLFGFCGLYAVIKKNTACPIKKEESR